ncbi:two-component system sensor histidine kinase NtrB [Caballeronia insecticola]|uniref:histidine kinase n=1 Tax=Caballeronia insecticola TaxID=758793 RepID=R4WSI4_9BURK|nr:ATP-binding protein [Caballeronia insecticola]BAN27549.1 PAS/PAC sensor signal transduction histidine kinase [Caballeronia insecticola]
MTTVSPNVIIAATKPDTVSSRQRRSTTPWPFRVLFSINETRSKARPAQELPELQELQEVKSNGSGEQGGPLQDLDNDQFKCALELLPFAILTSNPDNEILAANMGAQKLFGYSQIELLGESVNTLIPGLAYDVEATLADNRFRLPDPSVGGARDLVARRKDGTQFPAEITVNRLSSEQHAPTLTVVIDRTERYELQRHRQELAHLTRISTLGELAGSLAHELNQPLTAILSNVQAAQRFLNAQPIDLDEVREILVDLVDDNQRASEVIRRIRALVKKGELEAAPLDLSGVVGDVVLLLHSDAIVRGIRVFVNIAPDLPPVFGDRVQLQQVVLNLMLNAFDAMDREGQQIREVIIDATLDTKALLRVAVIDRGTGLEDNMMDKLFVPFFTSKRDGLGLGLSISRSIVEMHGGRIWAQSNPQGGAAFYFTLPVASAAALQLRNQP